MYKNIIKLKLVEVIHDIMLQNTDPITHTLVACKLEIINQENVVN